MMLATIILDPPSVPTRFWYPLFAIEPNHG